MRRATLLMAGLGGIAAVVIVAAALVCGTSGCSSLGYIGQSVGGHLDLMQSARPVNQWLADGATSDSLKGKLALTQRMRVFAVRELHLPDNASYTRYADIGRAAVVWNVVAAPELSLTLKTWCFPVMGCVGYRGYFDKTGADALAAELRAQGLEVDVYGVPAYSTLGWTNWLGGDPLLSTFINWPDAEVARLVFHELAHQVVYAADDTAFNESFAVAVERIGGTRWLAVEGDASSLREFEALQARREEFRALTLQTRTALAGLYGGPLTDADKRRRKAELFDTLRADYARLKSERWGGFAGYDGFIARANNATLAVQGAYNDLVPDFERLFQRSGGDFDAFYAEVKRLAALPKAERHATLRAP
ncbi:MAG TPA: aminopeptidase [Burkholderiaceae bacterium]|nr:aminopeptidase [Burkholderiaceae bacterium]